MQTGIFAIHVGDDVTVRCNDRCGNIPPGDYQAQVVDEDEKAIAIEGLCGPWWFYRTGEAYCGDASIVTPTL